jgi:cytochrome o ubiquinol oxidase subunit II
MKKTKYSAFVRGLSMASAILLSSCKAGVLDPKGPVGHDERTLIITAVLLMLVVVIPVIVMTLVFAWKYRASNKKAEYRPNWAHSTKIEIVVWTVPCIIILILGTLTWITTHSLDPFKPLETADSQKPITIEVVALDWKWLFIYPEQHIATVNQVAFPENVPVRFKVTSDTVMNSFFIPQLGSQIYAMAGMQTEVNLLAHETGAFDGMSAHFSGDGFSHMNFKALSQTPSQFKEWINKVKQAHRELDQNSYDALAKPSEQNPVAYYSSVKPDLFKSIVMNYMNTNSDMASEEMQSDSGVTDVR